MPSYSYPTSNGKYDFLITITLDHNTVTIRENWGLDGGGDLVSEDIHEFASLVEAQEFYLSQCRRDRYYEPPSDEELTLQRGEAVYLEFADGNSHKFYEVTVAGTDVVARYGRVGTKGQTHRTGAATPEGAIASGLSKLQEKQRKGYTQLPLVSSASESEVEPEPDTGENSDLPELTIEQFGRSAWQPIVVEGDRQLTASKFSGRPWLAQHESWFTCPCCSQPLQLFVQLNLSQLPSAVQGEYGTGLVQVFRCISETCGGQYTYDEPVVFYGRIPNLDQHVLVRLVDPQGPAALPPLPAIDGMPYETNFPAQTITDWQEITDYPALDELAALVEGWDAVKNGGTVDWDALLNRFGFADPEEMEENCPETVEGDKLAGYPDWSQDMEYPGCPVCQARMRQVLQLGSADHLPYHFGDMGTAHVLQCQTHKEQFAFVWACS